MQQLSWRPGQQWALQAPAPGARPCRLCRPISRSRHGQQLRCSIHPGRGGSHQQQLGRLLARAGRFPNQADTLFNPDRGDDFIGLAAVAEKPATRSVADLDYLSVRVRRRPLPPSCRPRSMRARRCGACAPNHAPPPCELLQDHCRY